MFEPAYNLFQPIATSLPRTGRFRSVDAPSGYERRTACLPRVGNKTTAVVGDPLTNRVVVPWKPETKNLGNNVIEHNASLRDDRSKFYAERSYSTSKCRDYARWNWSAARKRRNVIALKYSKASFSLRRSVSVRRRVSTSVVEM